MLSSMDNGVIFMQYFLSAVLFVFYFVCMQFLRLYGGLYFYIPFFFFEGELIHSKFCEYKCFLCIPV